MITTRAMLIGVARYLHAQGVGKYIEQGDTSSYFAPGDTAIVIGSMPTDPDKVICLGAYGGTESTSLAWDSPMVQVRTRGIPQDDLGPDDLADEVRNVLHQARYVPAGPGSLSSITRSSWVPLGEDSNQRGERSDNYRVLMSNRTANSNSTRSH